MRARFRPHSPHQACALTLSKAGVVDHERLDTGQLSIELSRQAS
jgi:hypothetical protein